MNISEQDLAKLLHDLKEKNSYFSEVNLKNFGKKLTIKTKDTKVDIPISSSKSINRNRDR